MSKISRKILMGAVASKRVPNAYLFVGADAQFLLSEAIFFASVLNCGENTGCGKCNACMKIAKSVHPDILVISRHGKSIKIDEIRQISEFVRFGPVLGGWKVIIIDGAQNMTPEASTSLLKMLEEPGKHILFILTTQREAYIQRTIISRCQKILFPGVVTIQENELMNELTEKIDSIKKTDLAYLLGLSDRLADAEDLENILNMTLFKLQGSIAGISKISPTSIKQIFGTLRALDRNANKRLALDNMFISMKEAANYQESGN